MKLRASQLAAAAMIAGAVALSAGTAKADAIGDVIKDRVQSVMTAAGGGLSPSEIAQLQTILNGTTDGATMMQALNAVGAGGSANLAGVVGSGLGQAATLLNTSNPLAAGQIQQFVAASGNPAMQTSFSAVAGNIQTAAGPGAGGGGGGSGGPTGGGSPGGSGGPTGSGSPFAGGGAGFASSGGSTFNSGYAGSIYSRPY